MKTFASLGKSVATLVLGIAVVLGTIVPAPTPARASGMPVFDIANFITNTVQTAILETLNALAWAVAKAAIQSMTRSIVNWINSGYQGEPAFSQNLKRDLRQVGDGVANVFLLNLSKGIQEGEIESQFAANIAKMTVTAYLLATSDKDLLAQRLKYTLMGYTNQSVAYMRGNLPPRGLQDWHSMIFQCGNDPICVSFATQESLVNQIDAEVQGWLADFNNGRGFLSWKGEECSATKSYAEGNKAYQQCVAENEASDGEPQDCFALLEDTNTSLSDADECVGHDVLTPGSVVEDALVENFGSPLRQLELADSINEIVGAVVTQMVGQVLGGGGLFGLSSPRSGGGARPINTATNPGTTGATIGAGFESIVTAERDATATARTQWAEIREVALRAKDACPVLAGAISLARLSDIQNTIEKADTAIARADTALGKLEEVLTTLEMANDLENSSGAVRATNSSRASQMYQELLGQNILLSSQEKTTASNERSEEAGSNSLFLKMSAYERTCS